MFLCVGGGSVLRVNYCQCGWWGGRGKGRDNRRQTNWRRDKATGKMDASRIRGHPDGRLTAANLFQTIICTQDTTRPKQNKQNKTKIWQLFSFMI